MADLVQHHTIRGETADAQVLADIDDNFRALFRAIGVLALGSGSLTPGTYGAAALIPVLVVNSSGAISSITEVAAVGGTDDAFVMAMSGI